MRKSHLMRISPDTGHQTAFAVRISIVVLALFAPLALPHPTSAAQQGPDGRVSLAQEAIPSSASSEADRGFLFERPRGTLAIRSGLLFHRAASDVFSFAEERFTVDRSDFRAISFGIEGAVWFGNHLEGSVTVEGSRVTLRSESRNWQEEDGSPILQSTRLSVGPSVSVGARYFLLQRGESLSRLAWIPQRWNIFGGAGVGVSSYRFAQWGDFVNESNANIFTTHLESEGAIVTPYLSGGGSILLRPRLFLLLEGRYQWGSTDLDQQYFTGFEPIDLAGLKTTMSVGYSF